MAGTWTCSNARLFVLSISAGKQPSGAKKRKSGESSKAKKARRLADGSATPVFRDPVMDKMEVRLRSQRILVARLRGPPGPAEEVRVTWGLGC